MKTSVEWHKEVLKRIEFLINENDMEINRLQKISNEIRIGYKFLEYQIEQAENRGIKGFDHTKFLGGTKELERRLESELGHS